MVFFLLLVPSGHSLLQFPLKPCLGLPCLQPPWPCAFHLCVPPRSFLLPFLWVGTSVLWQVPALAPLGPCLSTHLPGVQYPPPAGPALSVSSLGSPASLTFLSPHCPCLSPPHYFLSCVLHFLPLAHTPTPPLPPQPFPPSPWDRPYRGELLVLGMAGCTLWPQP